MRSRLFGLLTAAALFAAPLATAQAIETEQLREDLEAGLAQFAGPGVGLVYEELRVWPQDGGHRVQILGLTGQGEETEHWADLGDVAFSVQEIELGQFRVFDLDLPSSASFYEAGERVALLTYELTRFDGVWVGALSNFLDLDMLITDLRFAPTDGSMTLALERLGGVSRAERDAEGRIDQQTEGRATGLSVQAPGEGGLEIAEIEVETSVTGLDLAAYAQLNQEYEALAEREGPPSDADMAAFLQRLSSLALLPGSLAERFAISDIEVTDEAGRTQFRLDRGELDLAGSGLNQAQADLHFGLRHEALDLGESLRAEAGAKTALVPNDLGLVASLERLPIGSLWNSALQTLAFAAMQGAQGAENPMMGQMILFMMMGQLLPAMTEAGTQLKLPHFRAESEAAAVTAEGAFDVNPASPLGMTGRLDAAITGLDRVIALLEPEANAGDEESLQALGMAAWLKGLGRRETDSTGQAVDRYVLELTADGRTLLNGQPFGGPGLPE